MVKAPLIAVALMLAACTTTPEPAPVDDPREVWCEHNDARRPTPAVVEAMTRPELDEMNAHNRKGASWCGWTP